MRFHSKSTFEIKNNSMVSKTLVKLMLDYTSSTAQHATNNLPPNREGPVFVYKKKRMQHKELINDTILIT